MGELIRKSAQFKSGKELIGSAARVEKMLGASGAGIGKMAVGIGNMESGIGNFEA